MGSRELPEKLLCKPQTPQGLRPQYQMQVAVYEASLAHFQIDYSRIHTGPISVAKFIVRCKARVIWGVTPDLRFRLD